MLIQHALLPGLRPGAADLIATRIPPGQDFRIMDCGVAGLRFVDLMYFLASWGCGLAFFEKKNMKYKCRNSDKNHVQNMWEILDNPSKFIGNPSKINQKRSQIEKNTSLERFRCQIAPRSAPGRSPVEKVTGFYSFLGENGVSRDHFGAQLGSKIRQKSHFWV